MNDKNVEKEHFEPPRGMRDFYPEEMATRRAIFDAWEQAASQFGFLQYDASVVESLELLQAKSGEDIIRQIYSFKDKSGRMLALRPEMTPTLARMIASRQSALSFPLKWFSIAQCFRYERMSKGRKREHYQWNLDIIGETQLSAEAEVIACALHALSLLGIERKDVKVHLNSRILLSELLTKCAIPPTLHTPAFRALDKKEKQGEDEFNKLLKDSGLNGQQRKAASDLSHIETLDQATSILGRNTESINNLQSLFGLLEAYGIADQVAFDPGVVRGLDYYTGIVFEAFDAGKNFRAIFGGGRYDNLLQDLGGKPMTAVGLGFGDVVINELLSVKKDETNPGNLIDFAIGFMEDAQRQTAIKIAQAIRQKGKKVNMSLHSEKAKNFFSRAGKAAVNNAIFIGPDDIRQGTVRIKNLNNRTESESSLSELLA